MPTPRHTTTVEFNDELWELVEAEATLAGVSVPQFVHDAVIARVVVGPTDPRVFEVFAAAIRDAMHDEPLPARRREAERSLAMLARLSAARRRREARAVRAQSAQTIRMSRRRHEEAAAAADSADPPGVRSVFRVNSDWTGIREVGSHEVARDGDAPELSWLEEERIHPDDRQRVRTAIIHAIESRDIFEVRYRVQTDDMMRMVYLRALPLLTAVGTITEWVAVATDITDSTH